MEPLRSNDPGTVGPFRVQARLAGHQAGVVLLAYDQAGQQAAIAMLHTAAAGDPAARDRLTNAAEELGIDSPGQVLATGLTEPVPWVATAYAQDPPELALALLDAAALSGAGPAGSAALLHKVDAPGSGGLSGPEAAGPEPAAGPDFAPHWAGSPAAETLSAPPAPGSGSLTTKGPPPANSRRALLILGCCVAGAAALIAGVAGLVSLIGGGDDVREASPTDLPSLEALPTSEPGRTPARSDPPSPTPTVPNGPPGPVAGPTYGKGEETYLMDLTKNGFPFDFRAPGSWGCLKGEVEGRPEVLAWVCMDESGIWSGQEPAVRARAEIWVEPCPAPCGKAEWKALRTSGLDYPDELHATDATTMYGEKLTDSGTRIHVTMSHIFPSQGGRPAKHLGVEITGAPHDITTMQKLVNELRTRSG